MLAIFFNQKKSRVRSAKKETFFNYYKFNAFFILSWCELYFFIAQTNTHTHTL